MNRHWFDGHPPHDRADTSPVLQRVLWWIDSHGERIWDDLNDLGSGPVMISRQQAGANANLELGPKSNITTSGDMPRARNPLAQSVRRAVNPFVLLQFEARDFSLDPGFIGCRSELDVYAYF
jgi:hypothetical protein